MTLREFYETIGGDYNEVIGRIHSEKIITKFLLRFPDDKNVEAIKQALEDKNADSAYYHAHSLKGICLNLGLANLTDSSQQLTLSLKEGITPDSTILFKKVSQDYSDIISAINNLE